MEHEDGGESAFERVTRWVDRFVPAPMLASNDADVRRRARLLVGGSYLLSAIALFFIPPTLWAEGPSFNSVVLLGGAIGIGVAPTVLARTGSMLAATTLVLSVVAISLWSGAAISGGFEGSMLRFMGVVPLIASFLGNARLAVFFAFLMAGSIEVFYYLDVSGFPFRDVPNPEAERWFSAQAVVAELAFVTVFSWLFEASRRNAQRELRRSEAKLQESLAQLQTVVDGMADGLASFDREGRMISYNAALLRILGGPEEAGRRTLHDLLPPELGALVARALESGEAERTQLPLPADRVGAAVASPIEGEGATAAVVIVRDVTLETEIDRMKTDFIASVSHELRTPLTSILGFTKLTRNKLEASVFGHVPPTDAKAQKAVETARGNLDVVLVEGDRLTSLINDVLDISKMEAGRMEWHMEPLEPGAIVERAVAATAALFVDSDVEVRVELEPGLPTLVGDADRLQQVVINLISNAAKMTERGRVTVAARALEGAIELSVTDTGPGIDPALHDTIFEKFRQVGDVLTQSSRGSGLGLPICKQIVAAHEGRIGVESEPGRGARFVVRLPLEGPREREEP